LTNRSGPKIAIDLDDSSVRLKIMGVVLQKGIAEVFRTPPIFLAAGIEAVMYLGYGAFLGFLPIYAKNMGLNDAEVATILGRSWFSPW
jgi:hypothetical protein